jgi:hypothetical protein
MGYTMPEGSNAHRRSRGTRQHISRLLSVVLLGAVSDGCADRSSEITGVAVQPAEPNVTPRQQSGVVEFAQTTCGVNCLLAPGSVPGTYIKTLSTGINVYTAENSVVWPDTLNNATVMLMRVEGTIRRSYVSSMHPSWAHYQNTSYRAMDADGAFSGSYCYGEIRTDFRVNGNREYTLRSCTLTSPNTDYGSPLVSEKTIIGRLRGSGSVLRTGMLQPTVPGWYNCNSGPCVYAGAEAAQTITMHPWYDQLSLTALPAEVYEGDSVSFSWAVGGGMTLSSGSQRWS